MVKPLVFISHSAKDAFASEVLDALVRELEADFEVLLDRERLQPGDQWREEINTWIGLCHAAVVLFSRDALSSFWVLKEATNLTWRRELNRGFLVVPVRLSDVDAAELDAPRFSPLALNEIQAAGGETAGSIAARVRARLEPVRTALNTQGPLHELEHQVAFVLRPVEQRAPGTLARIAGAVGVDLGVWDPAHDVVSRFTRGLFHAGPERFAAVMQQLVPYLDEPGARQMLVILRPFWVEPQAAATIPQVTRRAPGERAVGVRAEWPDFTGRAYIQRACCRYPSWTVVTTTGVGGEDAAGALVREVRESLATVLGNSDDLDLLLEELEESEPLDPPFVIVRGDIAPEALRRLRESFPTVTVFLCWKEEPAGGGAQGVQLLEPALTPEQETRAYRQWLKAQSYVTRMNPRTGASG